MAEFKLVLSTKDGKSYQREVKDQDAAGLIGKKIGETVKGEEIGLTGYEFEITGGSDFCGFPMRKDVPGTTRKKIYAVGGVGIKRKAKGIKQRKNVCGNTISPKIAQINMKVTKQGSAKLSESAGAEGAEEKKETAEQKKEEKKEEKPEAKEGNKG
ncbi:30S ribosomal protein S6e [Candidatus Woesearchaeota archaeon]|nr:30S ribosomal protein S6e [Candidatus Woesearchaeota archaeon]